MEKDLPKKAIRLALLGKWEEAIKANKKILKNNPSDTEALNRLSKAYYETGKCKKALSLTKKVLKIDPQDQIATKCQEKYSLKKPSKSNISLTKITSFIEQPGKTKITQLVQLGNKNTLLTLCTGEKLTLKAGKHKVSVQNQQGDYIGKIPDDIAKTLIISQVKLTIPKAHVKCASSTNVKVFLRFTT
jgi:tetratricopeptide (TPR) repeat protein